MARKHFNIYNSFNDAYDFSIRITKNPDHYEIYFLQISAEFTEDDQDEYEMSSSHERVLYSAIFSKLSELEDIIIEAELNDAVIFNEGIVLQNILDGCNQYLGLKKLLGS